MTPYVDPNDLMRAQAEAQAQAAKSSSKGRKGKKKDEETEAPQQPALTEQADQDTAPIQEESAAPADTQPQLPDQTPEEAQQPVEETPDAADQAPEEESGHGDEDEKKES